MLINNEGLDTQLLSNENTLDFSKFNWLNVVDPSEEVLYIDSKQLLNFRSGEISIDFSEVTGYLANSQMENDTYTVVKLKHGTEYYVVMSNGSQTIWSLIDNNSIVNVDYSKIQNVPEYFLYSGSSKEFILNNDIQENQISYDRLAYDQNNQYNLLLSTGSSSNNSLQLGKITNNYFTQNSISGLNIQDSTIPDIKIISLSYSKLTSPPSYFLYNGASKEYILNSDIQTNEISYDRLAYDANNQYNLLLSTGSSSNNSLQLGKITNNYFISNTINGNVLSDNTISDSKIISLSYSKLTSPPSYFLYSGSSKQFILNNDIQENQISYDRLTYDVPNGYHVLCSEGLSIDNVLTLGSINNNYFADGSISGNKLANSSVTYSKLSITNSIESSDIVSLNGSKIQTGTLPISSLETETSKNFYVVEESYDGTTIYLDLIGNNNVSGSASISYSKLNLNNSIESTDIVSLSGNKIEDSTLSVNSLSEEGSAYLILQRASNNSQALYNYLQNESIETNTIEPSKLTYDTNLELNVLASIGLSSNNSIELTKIVNEHIDSNAEISMSKINFNYSQQWESTFEVVDYGNSRILDFSYMMEFTDSRVLPYWEYQGVIYDSSIEELGSPFLGFKKSAVGGSEQYSDYIDRCCVAFYAPYKSGVGSSVYVGINISTSSTSNFILSGWTLNQTASLSGSYTEQFYITSLGIYVATCLAKYKTNIKKISDDEQRNKNLLEELKNLSIFEYEHITSHHKQQEMKTKHNIDYNIPKQEGFIFEEIKNNKFLKIAHIDDHFEGGINLNEIAIKALEICRLEQLHIEKLEQRISLLEEKIFNNNSHDSFEMI